MRSLKITLRGTSALLMHSCAGVNPRNPITKELKVYTGKRKKTDEDLDAIARLEWESGLYYDKECGIYMPAECILATLIEGGKNEKQGANIRKYCNIPEARNKFDFGEKFKTLDDMYNVSDGRYIDVRPVNVKMSKVMRTRPRFPHWNVEFILFYEENFIELDTIVRALDYAGKFVGMCDNRSNGYGHFVAEVTELD